MRLVGLVVWLVGCHEGRAAQLRRDIAALEREVGALNREATLLRGVLEDLPPPTQASRRDNDPPGYDPTRPLPPGRAGQPDVLVLSIDTLRADHLGAYGYERDTSPFIDSLASGGTLFEQAWAPSPWTLPSHTTLLSGQLPMRHGAIEDDLAIPGDVPLLQSTFQRGGYRTFGAVATLFVSSRYGFDRGFDGFEDFGIQTKAENNLSTVDADHVFNHAWHWAQRQPDEMPQFLFLHVYDVHYNYDAPAPYNERFDRAPAWGDELYKTYWAYKKRMVPAVQLEHQIAQYDEEIAYVDDMLREFVERWRGTGRDLLVVVTADHGEEFGERGSWGHAHTLWPEQLRVPLVVNGPGVQVGRSTARIGLEDVAPTVAELAGLRFPAEDGRDRSAELRGGALEAPSASARLASTSRFQSMVLRWHDWPYDLHVDMTHRYRALCRLDRDPTCAADVYKQHSAKGEDMFRELMRSLGEPWQARVTGGVEVTDGYLFASGVRQNQYMDVTEGDTFLVVPSDASVVLHRGVMTTEGPWQPFGGTVPGDGCGARYTGRYTVGNAITVTADERTMLEQLGYLQDDAEDAAPAASGRQRCP